MTAIFRPRRNPIRFPVIWVVIGLAIISAGLSFGIHIGFGYGGPLDTMPYCLSILLAHVIFIKVIRNSFAKKRVAAQWTNLGFFTTYLAALIALYGINFAEIGLKDSAATATAPETHNFGTALFFSVITWTTVGYGDVTAVQPVARFFAAVEALNGYIVMGLFIAALVPSFQNLLTPRDKGGTDP
jgi:hypothetical protein